MKIQILGPPRSGTTCLYEAFRDSIKYTTGIFEPLNPKLQYKIPITPTLNPLLKTHLDFINSSQTNIIEKNVTAISPLLSFEEQVIPLTNFYKKYLVSFDKVILVYRNNTEDQAKSLKNCILSGNWFFPYKSKTTDYEDMLPIIHTQNKIVRNLSNFFNIPLTYYEDLYSDNIKYLDKFLKYYNTKLSSPEIFYHKMNTIHRLKKTL